MKLSAEPAPSRRVRICAGETSTVRPGDILVQPIDIEAFRRGVPPDIRMRGHFANVSAVYVETVCPDAYPEFIKLHPKRVPALRTAAMREVLLFTRDAVRLSHPDLPLAEGIRRVGRVRLQLVPSTAVAGPAQ